MKIQQESDIDVKALRKKNRLTQVQLANILGISVHTVRHWESHISEPSSASQTLLRMLADGKINIEEALEAK